MTRGSHLPSALPLVNVGPLLDGAADWLRSVVGPLDELSESVEDFGALLEMAAEDESIEQEVVSEVDRLEQLLEELELKALLSGPNDGAGAILNINARDGGTDANDWADMLLRMYMQWAQANEYSIATM